MKIIFTVLSILLVYSNIAYSVDYKTFDFSYNKSIAEDLNDDVGTTYFNDPDDKSMGIGISFGTNLEDSLRTETEINYIHNSEVNATSDVKLEISSISIMQSLYKDFDLKNLKFFLGAGAGIVRSNVDTSYNSSGTTFDGDKDNNELGYHISLGFEPNEKVLVMLRRADYGNVEGGSGTTSGGSSYSPDKFSYKVDSLIIKYKF